jgi:cell shape-determining protein MreC
MRDSNGQSLDKTSAVQSVIKFIEDDLFRMADEHKNGFDLVNENQQLKNQIATLETQLADIKKVFNGSS